ncbi:MAG: TetR/AcrR family transcriptional regulator [Coriobacteriia bacterium]|nr:TetR/AcrR family transcriptional regulator [Coriobacteriia bacterium]
MSSRTSAGSSILVSPASSRQASDSRNRDNRKTRYTNQVIRETFVELMKKQPIEKTTVTQICELADISRGTFYLHYRDVYDLLSCMENEVLADLERQLTLQSDTLGDDYSGNPDFWLGILHLLLERKDIARLLLANPHSSFMSKCLALNRAFSDELCEGMFPELSPRERDYLHCFYEHGSASIISLWVREGFVEPPEQIAELLAALNSKSCQSSGV